MDAKNDLPHGGEHNNLFSCCEVRTMAAQSNDWTFAKSNFVPCQKNGATCNVNGCTHPSYITFGFFNPNDVRYKSEDFPLLYAKKVWRCLLSVMDHKANRDAIRKEIKRQDKTTATANVVSNKTAEATGKTDVMSPAMVAQIAQIVQATIAASNQDDDE